MTEEDFLLKLSTIGCERLLLLVIAYGASRVSKLLYILLNNSSNSHVKASMYNMYCS